MKYAMGDFKTRAGRVSAGGTGRSPAARAKLGVV